MSADLGRISEQNIIDTSTKVENRRIGAFSLMAMTNRSVGAMDEYSLVLTFLMDFFKQFFS